MKDALLDSKLEAIMGGGTWAKPRGVQGFPLTARSEHEENRFHTHTVRSTWPPATETVRILVHRKTLLDRFPYIVANTPLVR
jgi:hypothetical protein